MDLMKLDLLNDRLLFIAYGMYEKAELLLMDTLGVALQRLETLISFRRNWLSGTVSLYGELSRTFLFSILTIESTAC
jgi:hypothetical protein